MRALKQAGRWVRLGFHMAVARFQSTRAHAQQNAAVSELERMNKSTKRVDRKMRLADAQSFVRDSEKTTDSAAHHWNRANSLAYKLMAPERIKHSIIRHGMRLSKRKLVMQQALKEWSDSEK